MFWGRLDQNSGVHGNRNLHWPIMGKMVSSPFLGCFWSDHGPAGNEDMNKISNEFEFRSVRTTDYGVSWHWGLKNSHRFIMGKWSLHASSFIFDQNIIKVAVNQARHKISDEFDHRPLVSMALLYVFVTFKWFTLIAENTTFVIGTFDSGERSLPFGLLVFYRF